MKVLPLHINLLVLCTLFFTVTMALQGCINGKRNLSIANFNPPIKSVTWHESVRRRILIESQDISDSSYLVESDSFYSVKYFSGKHLTALKRFTKKSKLISEEIYYSNDGDYELYFNWCVNGQLASESIKYKGNFYGIMSVGNCNGSLQEEGFVFKNVRIGTWITINQGGVLKKTEYGNEYLFDSLPPVVNRVE